MRGRSSESTQSCSGAAIAVGVVIYLSTILAVDDVGADTPLKRRTIASFESNQAAPNDYVTQAAGGTAASNGPVKPIRVEIPAALRREARPLSRGNSNGSRRLTNDPPPTMHVDQQLQLASAANPAAIGASHASETPTPVNRAAEPGAVDNRKLGRSPTANAKPLGNSRNPFSLDQVKLPSTSSLTTAGAGLGVVVGLFLICMWLLRRSRPDADRQLPSEALAILGRASLGGRHSAQLVRLGNKLLLLSVTDDGVQSLAEVTEPSEVDRIAGLCTNKQLHGPAAEFRHVLDQLAREPAQGFLDQPASG